MQLLKERPRKGMMNAVSGTVLAVVIVGVLLVVGTVILAQISSISQTSLGNNTNAAKMITFAFDLLFTTQGIIVLVVVVALLALVIYTVMNSLGGNAMKGR